MLLKKRKPNLLPKKQPNLNPQNQKKQLGTLGEQRVKKLLQSKGWQFVAQNFHTRFGEIDLIFLDGKTLVFVEVKTRSSRNHGYPEEAISPAKFRHLQKAAEIFLIKNPSLQNVPLRIDVAAVETGENTEIRYYQNASC